MIRFSPSGFIGLASAMILSTSTAIAQTTPAPEGQATPGARQPPAAQQGTPAPAPASNDPVVGGAPMSPTATIIENASKSADHTTLVSAIKAAGLDATLSGPGPFTVFAPTNDAFSRLAAGTLDTLMKPENKETLVKILQYHVVPGKLSFEDLKKLTTEQGGKASLTTANGEALTVVATANAIELTDPNGNKAYVSQPDVQQSNGIIHVTNGVVIPKLQ